MKKAGIKIAKIKAGKLRRYFDLKNFVDVFNVFIGIIQSIHYVWKFKPDIVFSKGGFAAVPPVIASFVFHIPVVTHESDVAAGLANRIIALFAKKILISFPGSEKYFSSKKIVLTGSPVRKILTMGDKKEAMNFFGFKGGAPVLLVYGGSQGSIKINNAIFELLPDLLEVCYVIHICGDKNFKELSDAIGKYHLKKIERYKLYPFLAENLKKAYAACDLIVSRAGAGSLSEIISIEKPAIVIPLSGSANNHQKINADFFEKKGIIIPVFEEDLEKENLIAAIHNILFKSKKRQEIIENIRLYKKTINKNPAKMIAEEILKTAV